ncbi:tyrosine-type recombinase/integrase [Sphingomonas sp. BIUV-7]|uniref:Tyrosine-type recombinase/integrase n=2 Tax=Sphingomonas natans TaxID=3063330 RepID=A0ABT8YCK4_9SPHN|nr:tyrosine-type recombinase/integrase [Sphingomonas sp. BIUV-7]
MIEGGDLSARAIETVREACKRYGRADVAVEARFRRHVYDDPVASVKLAKLRRGQLRAWRERLEQKPVFVGPSFNAERSARDRSPATVNRDMAMLRAALNRVLAPGAPGTEAAWQEALKPIRNAHRRRTVYLDRDQRRQLLDCIEPEAVPFVRTLCVLPLRPGAVAGLEVADFDCRTSELSVGRDKSGKSRRLQLPHAVAQLFLAQTAARPPRAPLFARLNGKPWNKDSWKRPIARAATQAGMPTGTTAYALRHSTITDLVNSGLPLLTVAQISDTSAEMIERHYGHLSGKITVQALDSLSL